MGSPKLDPETKIHVQIVNKGEGPGRTIRKWWERWKGADFLCRPPPRGSKSRNAGVKDYPGDTSVSGLQIVAVVHAKHIG